MKRNRLIVLLFVAVLLSAYSENGREYQQTADKIVESLSSPTYRAAKGD